MQLEKRPRHYALEICKLKTKEERLEALFLVPEHLREMTKVHVINTFALNAQRLVKYNLQPRFR
jgi:hypothetical protein